MCSSFIFRIALIAFLASMLVGRAGSVSLEIVREGSQIKGRWISDAVTIAPPFIHPGYTVERSFDLVEWEGLGAPIPGGLLNEGSVTHEVPLSPTEVETIFLRLVYRVNLAGAALSELDLAGADLSDADLSGADLSGANLREVNFSGATLGGANFAEATLAGAQFQGLAEPFSLTALGGDELAEASGMTP